MKDRNREVLAWFMLTTGLVLLAFAFISHTTNHIDKDPPIIKFKIKKEYGTR